MSTIRKEPEINRLFETFGSVLQIVGSIVLFPVRVLFFPIEAVFRSMGHTGDTENTDNSIAEIGVTASLIRWLRVAAKWVFAIPVLLLRSPFVIFRNLLRSDKRDLLFLAPAVAMICFLGYVFVQVGLRGNKITDQYRQGGYQAIENGNYPLAKTFFTRMLSDGELVPRDQFQWANVLANTGELQRATEILDGLAPEEGPAGFQPAHQMKAINLARQIGKSDDPSLLRRLKRHLDCCNKNASGLHRVWFAYYLAVSDSDNAMQKLVAASEREPQYWLTLADLFAKQGNNSSQARALEAAKKSCTSKIKENPLDIQARLGLAKTLIRQDNIDDAEILLQEGLKLTPNDEMKNVVSHFYLLRYDKATNENESFAKRFAHLEKSIELAAGNSGIYDRLTAMFMTESTKEKRTVIKNELLELIGGNNPTAVVHFALSNLYDLEGEREKSTWHLEQAYQLDNRSVAVANNLAWKLAHQKEPDLDKALELAKQAVEESSANSDYLDTYATVLLLRQEYELAIPQFQKAIGKNREKYLIHKKLAQCYRAIGRPELAKIHEKNSQAPKK